MHIWDRERLLEGGGRCNYVSSVHELPSRLTSVRVSTEACGQAGLPGLHRGFPRDHLPRGRPWVGHCHWRVQDTSCHNPSIDSAHASGLLSRRRMTVVNGFRNLFGFAA